MKKLFFVFFLLASFEPSFAQFTKGSFVVGGSTKLSADFSTSKYKSGGTTTTLGKSTSFTLYPQVGYFVMDNLALGGGVEISASSYKADGSSDKSSVKSFAVTPLARYYFDHFYVQGTVGFGSTKIKNRFGNSTSDSKTNLFSWSLMTGYAFLINDVVSFEPQIGYSSLSRKDSSDTKIINSGITIGIGLYAYIRK